MFWNSFKIAFSMYSKIPMPKTDWTKENMKYVMCFFPLIGVAIGGLIWLWSIISHKLQLGNTLNTAIIIMIPVMITGGIHLDGFIDTMDAINSYQPIERKLEILKDPHIGAFALISCVTYFIIDFGIWSEISEKAIILLWISFVLSRALSGFAIVTFPCAKKSGLVASFSDASQKNAIKVTMILYIIICIITMLLVDNLSGLISITSAFLTFLYYKIMTKRKFGGITN